MPLKTLKKEKKSRYLTSMAPESYTTRQLSLKNSFGFHCTCELCLFPPDQCQQSDQRLDEITRLDSLIGDGMRIDSAPMACLYDAYALLRLLEEGAYSRREDTETLLRCSADCAGQGGKLICNAGLSDSKLGLPSWIPDWSLNSLPFENIAPEGSSLPKE